MTTVELEQEIERLRNLLRWNHDAHCLALYQAVPCDCTARADVERAEHLRVTIDNLTRQGKRQPSESK